MKKALKRFFFSLTIMMFTQAHADIRFHDTYVTITTPNSNTVAVRIPVQHYVKLRNGTQFPLTIATYLPPWDLQAYPEIPASIRIELAPGSLAWCPIFHTSQQITLTKKTPLSSWAYLAYRFSIPLPQQLGQCWDLTMEQEEAFKQAQKEKWNSEKDHTYIIDLYKVAQECYPETQELKVTLALTLTEQENKTIVFRPEDITNFEPVTAQSPMTEKHVTNQCA
jgi:hypothetical protein